MQKKCQRAGHVIGTVKKFPLLLWLCEKIGKGRKDRRRSNCIFPTKVYKEERRKTLLDIAFASEIYALYKMTAHEFLHEKLESDGKAEKSKTAFLTRRSNSFLRRKNFLNKAV
jgi:hypothetical protein